MAQVQLNHICKSYTGSDKVVNDFNLDISDKEFIVFVGPSGCGKTTTLRMIAGLEDISSGDLFIGGRKVNDVPPKDRDIAMVFQNYALYPHMSVYKNMAFGLKLRKTPAAEIDRRVRDAAQILDIEHLLDRKPKALSGGQRQRVALGRAIIREPQVFLMDEPLSNLDAKLRVQMRAEIRKLHHRIQTTMIYVTHDQTEAMTMGDRIVVMKDGLVQQADTPAQVYHHPANRFVAGFIGSPAMNFVTGDIVEENGDLYFKSPSLSIPMTGDHASTLKQHGAVGQSIVLGIRPEDLHCDDLALSAYPDATFPCIVEVVENMGAEVYLHLMNAGQSFIARVPSRVQPQVGEHLHCVVDLNKIHLFDVETGQNIGRVHAENAVG